MSFDKITRQVLNDASAPCTQAEARALARCSQEEALSALGLLGNLLFDRTLVQLSLNAREKIGYSSATLDLSTTNTV